MIDRMRRNVPSFLMLRLECTFVKILTTKIVLAIEGVGDPLAASANISTRKQNSTQAYLNMEKYCAKCFQ